MPALSKDLQESKLCAEELERKLNDSILGLEDRLEKWDQRCYKVFIAVPGTFDVVTRSEPVWEFENGAATQTTMEYALQQVEGKTVPKTFLEHSEGNLQNEVPSNKWLGFHNPDALPANEANQWSTNEIKQIEDSSIKSPALDNAHTLPAKAASPWSTNEIEGPSIKSPAFHKPHASPTKADNQLSTNEVKQGLPKTLNATAQQQTHKPVYQGEATTNTSTPSTFASRIPTEIQKTNFRDSKFKSLYTGAGSAKNYWELLQLLRHFIDLYCIKCRIHPSYGKTFCDKIWEEAATQKEAEEEMLRKVNHFAQRLWTSVTKMKGMGAQEHELCFLINDVIRSDDQQLLEPIVKIIRSINAINAVSSQAPVLPPGHWPENGCCFRGTALPDEHKRFYREGVKFRVPGFLATSFSVDVARSFMARARKSTVNSLTGPPATPVVLFKVFVDPDGGSNPAKRCRHVTYVTSSNVGTEREFLFAPYSVFTVRKAAWSNNPDCDTPHEIHLEAAYDNAVEPEDLPLAPWY